LGRTLGGGLRENRRADFLINLDHPDQGDGRRRILGDLDKDLVVALAEEALETEDRNPLATLSVRIGLEKLRIVKPLLLGVKDHFDRRWRSLLHPNPEIGRLGIRTNPHQATDAQAHDQGQAGQKRA
jgi:hypothetical protein